MQGIVRCLQERGEADLIPISLVDQICRWLKQTYDSYRDRANIQRED
jgi:hypothetical protein